MLGHGIHQAAGEDGAVEVVAYVADASAAEAVSEVRVFREAHH